MQQRFDMNVLDFLNELDAAYPGLHTLPAAALSGEFNMLTSKYGLVPQFITELWSRHNGIEYCVRSMPLLWLFPISPNPKDLWATNQSITEYTGLWRQSTDRCHDWVIGTWNDGRVLILSGGNVTVWDSNLKRKAGEPMSVEEWLDLVVREGGSYMEG